MSKLKIEIDIDAVVLEVNSWEVEEDVGRLLREIESDIMDGETEGVLTSINENGKVMGKWSIE